MKFSYSRWPLRILWLALSFSYAFYFRTEAATYEIYENKTHTKYSEFTVLGTDFYGVHPLTIEVDNWKRIHEVFILM